MVSGVRSDVLFQCQLWWGEVLQARSPALPQERVTNLLWEALGDWTKVWEAAGIWDCSGLQGNHTVDSLFPQHIQSHRFDVLKIWPSCFALCRIWFSSASVPRDRIVSVLTEIGFSVFCLSLWIEKNGHSWIVSVLTEIWFHPRFYTMHARCGHACCTTLGSDPLNVLCHLVLWSSWPPCPVSQEPFPGLTIGGFGIRVWSLWSLVVCAQLYTDGSRVIRIPGQSPKKHGENFLSPLC